MMNILRFDLKIKCLSPLAHFGDELCGTMQTARRMKYKVNNRFIDVPVYSGNALRGILRGLLMQDMLERLDMSVHSISQAVFYTLFNGGSLKSGGIEDLEEAEQVVAKLSSMPGRIPGGMPYIFISPVFGTISNELIVEWVLNSRTLTENNARFQVQLHKVIWDPNRRGV